MAYTLLEPEVQWIILDNGSEDGTADWLAKVAQQYSAVKVILSNENTGVAEGRDILLSHATGKFCLFLDSDVVVTDRAWLPKLLNPLNDPVVGVTGPAGHWLTKGWRWYDQAPKDLNGPVDVVSGYCQAFRREIVKMHNVEGVGLELDLTFGPYWHEDSDWCLQARSMGLEVIQVPGLGLIHMFAGTGDHGDGPAKQEYMARKWRGRGLVQFEQEIYHERKN
jgi:GT2 family glycosyltransferase